MSTRMDDEPEYLTLEERRWAEQAAFDRQLRELPKTYEERTAMTKEFVLHMVSELDELLRAAGAWKPHRRIDVPENRAQVRIELTDAYKYWIAICQIWGFTPSEMDDAFWQKSMVVRQRYSEEWVQTIDRPCVIVDIDNILCDYVGGLVNWLWENSYISEDRAQLLRRTRPILNAESVGIPHVEWRSIKHTFRVSGAKTTLPVMPHAVAFTHSVRQAGYMVVLLTSRPIDRYPNIYSDTLRWLQTNHIAYDFVWWAHDKAGLVLDRGVIDHVRYVVDDDLQFIQQFAPYVRCYWMRGDHDLPPHMYAQFAGKNIVKLRTFEHLLRVESEFSRGVYDAIR